MPPTRFESSSELIHFAPEVKDPVIHNVRHDLLRPPSGISFSWSNGNVLRVAFLRHRKTAFSGSEEDVDDEDSGGKVVELRFPSDIGEFDESRKRKIAYGSATAFSVLERKRQVMSASLKAADQELWCEYVMDFSKSIKELLGVSTDASLPIIDNPKEILKSSKEPTYSRAAWELLEMFYVEHHASSWISERLVDWLADYDCLLSLTGVTVHLKLVELQKKLDCVQFVENNLDYWDGIASALSIGWLDTAVKLLRLHGSYRLDQLDDRETENGLVEAVAVLISTMPRMRPDIPAGGLGQCFQTKLDFIKAWEKWRAQVTKLDCSGFWIRCEHRQTMNGLKKLLQVMLGNVDTLKVTTCHWVELCISHFLHVRPLTTGLDAMHSLAQQCIKLKPSPNNCLLGLILGIIGDSIEVILAECWKSFGAWMVAHAMELLTARNHQSDLLHKEQYNLGEISIQELYRLVYAQVLSSHPSTWQIAPTYLATCPRQGLGLLEILLYRQSVQHSQTMLKNLELCRFYELRDLSSCIMTVAGMHHWKHGRKGLGIFWLQQGHDEDRLSQIAQQLFDFIGKSLSDDSFKQLEGLIELLGNETTKAGNLDFLGMYRDFKRSLEKFKMELDGEVKVERVFTDARQSMEFLLQMMKNPSTPQRFWLPLLHDSLTLLNWRDAVLLKTSEVNLLLRRLQELSLSKLHDNAHEDVHVAADVLGSVRLALATNLGRAFLEE